MSAGVNAMSDIDGHQVNVPARRQPLGGFQLFAFSAKLDPVATMLVQNHRAVISDYYGVTTSFMRSALRPAVTVLAYEEGAPWVKYIHGDLGRVRGRTSGDTIPRTRSTTSVRRPPTSRCIPVRRGTG